MDSALPSKRMAVLVILPPMQTLALFRKVNSSHWPTSAVRFEFFSRYYLRAKARAFGSRSARVAPSHTRADQSSSTACWRICGSKNIFTRGLC